MKVTYQHEVTTSFVLWFDNYLLNKADAYSNLTGKYYYTPDERLMDAASYSSPYKQWVTDSSIDGAEIPSGVYNNGDFIERGESGLKLDFENGRAIMDSSVGVDQNLTGTFAVKDFNIYVTDQNEEDLLIESNHRVNSRFFDQIDGIPPYDQTVPAIFISNDGSRNDPFSFGGEDKTTTYFRAAVIAENLYGLDGVLSVFSDSSHEVFNKIDFEDFPLDEFGDLKSGDYNGGQDATYNYDLLKQKNDNDIFMIQKVGASRMSDNLRKVIIDNLFVGFLDFEVIKYRYPRL